MFSTHSPIILHTRVRWAAAFYCSMLAWACTASTPSAEEPVKAVLWVAGMTPARIDYASDVVKLALEKSQGKYGRYIFETNAKNLSNPRAIRAMREGELINIISSPVWANSSREDFPLNIIRIPISHGLLGYRQPIVRKEDLPRFAKVDSLADLQKLTAGLGSNWTELDIFNANGLKWHGGKDIPQLHSMLSRARFDYLPLSIVEAEESLATSPYRDQLAIVPGLIIYYSHPAFIQVSINKPRLTERLEYGLRRAQADGSLKALFDQHYGALVKRLKSHPMRVIVLQHPNAESFIESAKLTFFNEG